MTARYNGWLASRGVTPANAELVNREGRTLLAFVMQQRTFANVGFYQVKKFLPDGSMLIASYDGHTPILTLVSSQQAQRTLDTVSTLWLPRGFVVYPSSSSSSTGWGTPVVTTSDSIFAQSNIAPGLDVARWTTGGSLGEVFISRQADAGYPKKFYGISPAFYSTNEAPSLAVTANGQAVGIGIFFKPPATTAWTGYRIAFDNFVESDPVGGLAKQAIFSTVHLATQYCLPPRGYYHPADRGKTYVSSADFGSDPWIDDAPLTNAPVGYATFQQRANKDGVLALSHEVITTVSDSATLLSVIDTEAHLSDSTFAQPSTSLDFSVGNGVTVCTPMQRDQWIAYGVRQWIGDDPTLPVISWDGFPSWNWPAYLVLGTIQSGAWVDLDYYTINVRGTDRKLFSKRVCANGRVLGTLPDWVLSAGVQTRVEHGVTIDRLIALCFRLSDQPPYVASGPGSFEPYVKTLRVYFVDIARRNNLTLLPDHAVIGLYDATTNPNGWHAAGTFDIYPPGFLATGSYSSLLQTPQFKGDGTRAVWIAANYDSGTTIHTGAFAIEGTFGTITDGSTTVTSALVDLETRSEGGIVFSHSGFCYGIDYLPNALTVRFFYSCGATYEDMELTDTVLRWSGIGRGTGLIAPSDIKCNTAFLDGYAFSAAWTLDPVKGAMVGMQQKASGGHAQSWRQQYTVNGAACVSTDIADGVSGFPTWQNDVSLFANGAYLGMSVFAKSGDNYIAGLELSPNGTFLNSFFDSTVGDLATLTQTPGSGLRLYPAGAV